MAYLTLPANVYDLPLVLLPQIVFGVGVALTQVALAPLVIRTLPPSLHRVGLVVQLVIQFLGGMFGTVWARHLVDNIAPAFRPVLSQTSAPHPPAMAGKAAFSLSQAFAYNETFLILGGVSLLASFFVLLLPVKERFSTGLALRASFRKESGNGS